VFVIGLVTGDVDLLTTYIKSREAISLTLLIIGIVVLAVVFGLLLRSLLKIVKLTNY